MSGDRKIHGCQHVSRPKNAGSQTPRLGMGVHCVTPTLEKLEQGDSEFKANLKHTVRCCLKNPLKSDCKPEAVDQGKE